MNNFKAVEFMRARRDAISKKIEHMTQKELLEYFNKQFEELRRAFSKKPNRKRTAQPSMVAEKKPTYGK